MVGRALRPHPDKDKAIIIDIAGNYDRHGMPDDARIWTLDGIEKKQRERKAYERDPKTDKIIEVEVKIAATNTEFIKIGSKKIELTPELQPWIDEIDNLIAEAGARGYKAQWAVYRIMDAATKGYMPPEAWRYIGSKLGYHHKWADHKIEEIAHNS
jgi:superfamily II DNA or RNA helicase